MPDHMEQAAIYEWGRANRLEARVAELEEEKRWNDSWAKMPYDLVRTLISERDELEAEVLRLKAILRHLTAEAKAVLGV